MRITEPMNQFAAKIITIALSRLIVIGSVMAVIGCASDSERYHPEYEKYVAGFETLLLMPPEICIMEEQQDGRLVSRDQWSADAQILAQQAVAQLLTRYQFQVKELDQAAANSEQITEIHHLFRAVNRSIQLHTYGPQIFPRMQQDFDYSIGSVEALLNAHGADALILMAGHQTLSPTRPRVWISMAIAEPGGRIVWYSLNGAKENLNLIDNKNMNLLIHKTLNNFKRHVK